MLVHDYPYLVGVVSNAQAVRRCQLKCPNMRPHVWYLLAWRWEQTSIGKMFDIVSLQTREEFSLHMFEHVFCC